MTVVFLECAQQVYEHFNAVVGDTQHQGRVERHFPLFDHLNFGVQNIL